MNETETLLSAATEAAKRGGEVLMRHLQQGVQMRSKADDGGKTYDLVSDADLESERVIGEYLSGLFPSHELLGEENLDGSLSADHLWIIDPLDGTNNFAHEIPHFAVSIAHYHLGQPTVGVVFNPARGEWFTAVAGGGAFRDGRPVQVCASPTLAHTLVGCGFYYDRGDMMRSTLSAIEECFGRDIHGIRRFGTASLDLCMVGCGQLGAFFEYKLSPWDFAAGRLFVEEAGGKVSDARGNALPLESTSVVASNRQLHESMIEITAKHHPA